MKKMFLCLAFVLTVSVANAWWRNSEEAVVIVAKEHLTPKADKMVNKYLGKSYADDVQYLYDLEKSKAKEVKLSKKARRKAAEIHYLHLDENFQPKKVKGKDAFKATEAALAIIRDCKSHSKAEVTTALRTVINLMCDMHHLWRIRIDGIAHSQRDFSYVVPRGEVGKMKDQLISNKWSKSWNSFDGGGNCYSAKYWAEDIRIYLGDRYADYAKGNLRDWIADNGRLAAHYLEICKPGQITSYMDRKMMQPENYDMMVKAACRLATLLNEVAE
ncbi:MAG: hypothetical protein IKY57_03135 [Alistipes sp.]|nr:hypothetical protein [Alistipes sp.]